MTFTFTFTSLFCVYDNKYSNCQTHLTLTIEPICISHFFLNWHFPRLNLNVHLNTICILSKLRWKCTFLRYLNPQSCGRSHCSCTWVCQTFPSPIWLRFLWAEVAHNTSWTPPFPWSGLPAGSWIAHAARPALPPHPPWPWCCPLICSGPSRLGCSWKALPVRCCQKWFRPSTTRGQAWGWGRGIGLSRLH